MEKLRPSFIVTVFNEEETIKRLLDSLVEQSVLPSEVVITDGGSTDSTVLYIEAYKTKLTALGVPLKLIIKKGNRAVGRNEAIKQATGNIILCSDAGCILEKDWVENMLKPFKNNDIDVVAGYYEGLANNAFEKSIVPYILVMEDKVNDKSFLPASRSMAMRKSVWEKTGGFPINYSHNEDYVFAKTLVKTKANIVFQKNAIVYWLPRKTGLEAFIMFYRFALGDAESGIIRPKVILIFARYIICSLFLYLFFKGFTVMGTVIVLACICYFLWAIKKNYRYVRQIQAVMYLPLLQLISDSAVLTGTIYGSLNRLWDTLKKQ